MLTLDIIPTHRVAVWLLKHIDLWLDYLGLRHHQVVEEVIYAIVIAALAIVIGWAIKRTVLAIARRIVAMRHTEVGEALLRERVLTRCSHIIPPLVFMALIPFAFNYGSKVLDYIFRFVGIYALIAFGIGLGAVLTFIFNRYDERENTRNLPIRGVLNIAKGIMWIVITIIAISILIDKSPGTLLAGLGAFAAALMLIFKDSILGFVAGIQMSQNDMLHVGDWIVVPSTIANGIVLDVSLSTVKVQNFDKTIVMVPPYTLVSTSFQNYRGMSASGTRRIMQSFTIDYSTISPLAGDTLTAIESKYPELKGFADSVGPDGAAYNPDQRGVSGTVQTNLGIFRAYLCQYLLKHPMVSKTDQILVRLQQSTEDGMPLQIWCFTATSNWNEYEAIQSQILEHILTVAPDFGLAIYSSGSLDVDLTNPQAQASAATNAPLSPN